MYAIIFGVVRTAGAGVGRLIPRLTEEEIAILLAGLGALGLWLLLQWLATQNLPLPRAATQAATATPSKQRAAMRIQLQQQIAPGPQGTVTYQPTFPLVGANPDGTGVTTGQVIAALALVRTNPAIPKGAQAAASQAIANAIAWTQTRPPYGVFGVVKMSFPFIDPKKPEEALEVRHR